MNPCGIRFVDAGRAGQGTLGQRADGDEAADHGVGILATLGHGPHESRVPSLGGLDGVVVVAGEHASLEGAYHFSTLTDGTNVLGGYWTHTGSSRLASVRIFSAVLAADRDAFSLAVLNVSRADDSTHMYYKLRKILGPASKKHL